MIKICSYALKPSVRQRTIQYYDDSYAPVQSSFYLYCFFMHLREQDADIRPGLHQSGDGTRRIMSKWHNVIYVLIDSFILHISAHPLWWSTGLKHEYL